MKNGFLKRRSQESFAEDLFEPLGQLCNTQTFMNPSAASRLMKQGKINDAFIKAAGLPSARQHCLNYFKTTFFNDMNAATFDTCCIKILHSIENDPDVLDEKKKILKEEFSSDRQAFFVDAFFQALAMDSTIEKKPENSKDTTFLLEVSNHCPICHRSLITTKNGKRSSRYQITKIYDFGFPQAVLQTFKTISKVPSNEESTDNKNK